MTIQMKFICWVNGGDCVAGHAPLPHHSANHLAIQSLSTIGAFIITYTMLAGLYYSYSIMGPKNL